MYVYLRIRKSAMEIINATKRKVLSFLGKRGYQLLRTTELNEKVDYYRKILIESKVGKREQQIDSIVFSKDRAMQLYAFLKSYVEMVSGRGTMYVLYKVTGRWAARPTIPAARPHRYLRAARAAGCR